ncbi:unnamed protein product, partial [marine sediment metagenome]
MTERYAIEYIDIADKIACSWHDYNVFKIVEVKKWQMKMMQNSRKRRKNK